MYKNKQVYLLFFGDIIVLFLALYLTLLVRYFEIPSEVTLLKHLLPFSVLIFSWCVIFLIVGLYERHILVLKRNLPEIIVNTQIFNCILAAVFFYFIPSFSLAPKIVLFIYLLISLALIFIWRLYVYQKITRTFTQNAVVIGDGDDVGEIVSELKRDSSYGLFVKKHIHLNEIDNIENIIPKDTAIVVADFGRQEVRDAMPKIYKMIFSGAEFIKIHDLYESMFGRVALSSVDYDWFVENITSVQKIAYSILKRLIDIIMPILISPFFFLFFPFVALAIKIEDGGNIFLTQDRVGKNGKIFKHYKFRSMNVSDAGVWVTDEDSRVTRVGKFIRKTRIDELPQIWNVFRGDISMIGPRPDMIKLWKELSSEISFYQIRNIVKPGLSGWAQITQEFPPRTIDENRMRLSYDLFYVKHRSILLDLKIAIRTIKTLISRTGV